MAQHERGLIIGPDESVHEFEMRSKLKEHSTFPSRLKELFGVSPDWVAVNYDNKGLRLWEGACSWIDAHGASIQLRRSFETKKRLWGIYSKEELLAHEGVHAARVAFEEPVFEEVLAYQTSKSAFRRYLGPIFRSSKESLIFMCSVAIASFFHPAIYVSIALALLGMGRLMITQNRFTKAKQELEQLFGKSKALPMLLHLTDREIILFSKGKDSVGYIKEQTCARWVQIKSEFDVESYSQFQAPSDI